MRNTAGIWTTWGGRSLRFETFLAGVNEEYAVLLEQVGLLEAK